MESFVFNPAVPAACLAPGSRLSPVPVFRLRTLRTNSRALRSQFPLEVFQVQKPATSTVGLDKQNYHYRLNTEKLSFSGLFTQLTAAKHDIKPLNSLGSWFETFPSA